MITVNFLRTDNDKVCVKVEEGTTLMQAAKQADIKEIPADCNWPSVHAAWTEVNKTNKGLNFMMKIFETRFEKGLNVGDKDIIRSICEDIDVEPNIAISAMDDEDIDNDLKSLTKIMRELKVFGVPTFIYKKERFWGQDRLNYLKNIKDN